MIFPYNKEEESGFATVSGLVVFFITRITSKIEEFLSYDILGHSRPMRKAKIR